MVKHLYVSAAVIVYQNKILCMQRAENKYPYISKKYEFPGGKIEANEENWQALMRELNEEMNMNVLICAQDFLLTVEHNYPDFSLTMDTFLCKVTTPEFIRKEHINHQWLSVSELNQLDWAAADWDIVNYLQNNYRGRL